MSNNKRPRICIGMPCYGNVANDVLEDWGRFWFHLGRRLPQYDFFCAIKTKSEQFRARNAIVQAAQQANCDWLLMIDDDMIINPHVTTGPTEEYGFIEKLIAHDKDICGVLYYQRAGECEPVVMRKAGDGHGYCFLKDDEITRGLQPVDVAGGGCLLIKMRVFDHLKFPYFAPEYEFGTDIQLCRKAQEAGFEVWADTSIELGHVRDERVIVTSRNRKTLQLENATPGEMKQRFISDDVYDQLITDVLKYTGLKSWEQAAEFVQTHDFHKYHTAGEPVDIAWYRKYPHERIIRQLVFNVASPDKRQMTNFIMSAIDPRKSVDILDFGCGIGIPTFHFAEKGHRVTACDLEGTGTLEFLKWRVKEHKLPMTFHESRGGVPHLGGATYDVIVAMDSIEHVEDWRTLTRELIAHLKPGGAFFTNNAILNDDAHLEHYPIDNQEFLRICVDCGLTPINQFAFMKRMEKTAAA